jgi:hypothetical protein
MTELPIVVGYYGTDLVGTSEDIYGDGDFWTFAIGSGDGPRGHTKPVYANLIEWLAANKFSPTMFEAAPHKHNMAPVKAWLDFFDANDAMRFRLIAGGTHRPALTFDGDLK